MYMFLIMQISGVSKVSGKFELPKKKKVISEIVIGAQIVRIRARLLFRELISRVA